VKDSAQESHLYRHRRNSYCSLQAVLRPRIMHDLCRSSSRIPPSRHPVYAWPCSRVSWMTWDSQTIHLAVKRPNHHCARGRWWC